MENNRTLIDFVKTSKKGAVAACLDGGQDNNDSLEKLRQQLIKEQKRVIQWRILNEATVILNSQLHSESLPLKFIKCAKKLVSAKEALLALKEEDESLTIIKHFTRNEQIKGEKRTDLIEEKGQQPQGVIQVILQKGQVINRDSSHFCSQDLYGFSAIKKNLLGVPLFANGVVIGALLMANKKGEEFFTQDDQELLIILGTQLGIALENSRLYEKIDEKLQKKVNELEQVNKILVNQHNVLAESLELHKQLTESVLRGKGIEAICKMLTSFIGCPVQVEDHNFHIKATTITGSTKLFLCGKDLIENKLYSEQAKELFEKKKPVKILIDTAITQYLVPIVAGEQILGIVTTVLVNKTLKPLSQVAMEQGATIIALEMLRQKSVVEQTRRLKENFLEELLAGEIESEEFAQHRALQLDFSIKNSYQIMAIHIEPSKNGRSRPEVFQEIRELCVDSFSNSIAVTRNNILLIMFTFIQKNQEIGHKSVNLIKERLMQLAGEGIWRIAIGTNCNKISDCLISYRKAVTALEIMQALRLNNKIVFYKNLGIFSLIEINPQRFADFTQKTLGLLIEYDQKHKTQLVETLNLYFNYNSNVLKASREGYLNPSTMKYRLKRIQEITGLDLKDADVGLQLQLAMRLINCDCK